MNKVSGKIKASAGGRLSDLMRVYEDLEDTLKGLRQMARKSSSMPLTQINLQKLITQMSKNKKRLERKIATTFLLETTYLKKRFGGIASKVGRTKRHSSATNTRIPS